MNQHSTEERTAILNRLKSAEGHLRAIVGMMETGRPCAEILHQLDAVGAAITVVGCALRACEFRDCTDIILHSPDTEARAAEVRRLEALYGLPTQRFTVKEINPDEQPT